MNPELYLKHHQVYSYQPAPFMQPIHTTTESVHVAKVKAGADVLESEKTVGQPLPFALGVERTENLIYPSHQSNGSYQWLHTWEVFRDP